MNKTILIDAGHGGIDSGAIGLNIREKDITLDYALKVRDILEQLGFTVILSRNTDSTVSLEDRTKLANGKNVDLFLSIHINSASSDKAQGVETFYHDGSSKGKKFANAIQKNVKGFYTKDRGVKTANFYVLRKTVMPSSLVELGFIRNNEDMQVTLGKIDEIAKGLVKAICEYFGVPFEKKDHWCEKHFQSLNEKGLTIHDRRFEDPIKRAEVFALLDRLTDLK